MLTTKRPPAVPLGRLEGVLNQIQKGNLSSIPTAQLFKKGSGFNPSGILEGFCRLWACNGTKEIRFILHTQYVGLCSLIGREKPYNQIPTNTSNKIMLGGIPTCKTNMGSLNQKYIAGVLAVCQDWERDGSKLSTLRTPSKQEWASTGAVLEAIDKRDHIPLNVDELHSAADFINEKLADGDVYVHCKAGHGRSAQAVVAYFIKYEDMAPAEAITLVKQHRQKASLMTLTQIKSKFPKAELQNVEDNKKSIDAAIKKIKEKNDKNRDQTKALKQLIRLFNFHELRDQTPSSRTQ